MQSSLFAETMCTKWTWSGTSEPSGGVCAAGPAVSPALQKSRFVGDASVDLRGYLNQECEDSGGPAEETVGERGAFVRLRAPAAPTPTKSRNTTCKLLGLMHSMHYRSRSFGRACWSNSRRTCAGISVAIDYVYLGERQGDDAERQCPILVVKGVIVH